MTSLRLLAILPLLALACGAGEDSGASTGSGGTGVMPCATDQQCNGGSACMTGICVGPSPALVGMAVEIQATPARAFTAGVTEDLERDLSGRMPLELRMGAVEPVKLTFIPGPGSDALVPVPANVLYTVPSRIPRRPPLVFEWVLLAANDSVLLALPTDLAGRDAAIRLLPRAGPDQTSPPFVFAAPPGSPKELHIPTDRYAIRGTLRSAAGASPGAYVARAFQGGELISNRPQLDDDGRFVLIIPATAAASDVSVELVPTGDTARPWFKFEPFTPSKRTQTRTVELGTVMLAAYVAATDGVLISAVADTPERRPIAAALVRASVTLEAGPVGTSQFQRDSTTDPKGIATLALLPEPAQGERKYDIRIFPEAGAEYASECRTMVTVTGPGRLLEVPLKRRPLRSGTLQSARGTPVASASIVATRLPSATTECSSPVQLTTTTNTNANGIFELHLDPGSYQIDFIPQAGSAAPRVTRYETITGDDDRVVTLPEGALVKGTVLDSVGDGDPVANARVRIFDPRCLTVEPCSLPPTLLAETQTDAQGHFRVVAAVP